jgi:UDP-GlcNAc:undecaprenyl-phosphate GlcNAc-1-phosphate transferase
LVALAAGAAVVAAIATPAFGILARRFGLVVAPQADRWHSRATPLLGGAAMAIAIIVALVVILPGSRASTVIIVGVAASFALGLLDDFRRMSPTTKLAGQAIIAAGLFFGGVRVEIITFEPVAFVVTVLWVVGLMNAINLMDNMDGLAAGIAAIASVALAVAAYPENIPVVLIGVVTAGAALGFLVYNFNPARIFMGDAGSMMLGFLLAATAILHTASSAANVGLAVLAPLAVLALPIFDTALVTTSRRLAGRPISQGGRDHTSHRLAALGLTDRGVVLFLYAVAASLAGVALIAETVSGLFLPLFALAVVALVLFGLFLYEVDVYGARPSDARKAGPVAAGIATYGRFGAEIALDLVLLTVAYYLAFVLRFESFPQSAWLYLFAGTVPVVVSVQLVALVASRAYRTLWRFLALTDVLLMARALTVGTLVVAALLLVVAPTPGYSKAVLVLDWLLAMALVVGVRGAVVWLRHWFTLRPRSNARKVLIIGATDAGALALRLIARMSDARYEAVGFLDDDPGKRYRRIAGVPIVGTTDDLATVLPKYHVDLVLYANDLPVSDTSLVERLEATSRHFGAEWRQFATSASQLSQSFQSR